MTGDAFSQDLPEDGFGGNGHRSGVGCLPSSLTESAFATCLRRASHRAGGLHVAHRRGWNSYRSHFKQLAVLTF